MLGASRTRNNKQSTNSREVNCQLLARQRLSVGGSTDNGFTLVELLAAMALLGIASVALVTTSLFTQKAARSASSEVQATKFSEESVEQMRIFRDRAGFGSLVNGDCWKLVTPDLSNPELWKLSNSAPDVCPDVFTVGNTTFNRSIKVEDGVNANQKKITVTVTWGDGAGTKTVTSETVLSSAVGDF